MRMNSWTQPTYDGRPFDLLYSVDNPRTGEGHVAADAPNGPSEKDVQHLIDQLGSLSQLGATITVPPVPPRQDLDKYLDYAQWVIKEVKPRLP
jgi:hypothetical protein